MALTLTSIQQQPPEFTATDSCGFCPQHVNDFLVARGWINNGHMQAPAWEKLNQQGQVVAHSSIQGQELDIGAKFTWMEAVSWEMYRTFFMAKGPGE